MWKNRAESIGTNKDLIILFFGTFMRERGDVYKNGQFYPWIASIRAIYASVMIKGKQLFKNKYIGYRVLNEPHSNELRNNKISEFFDNLKFI